MTSPIESRVQRYVGQLGDVGKISRLNGGISSENYKVRLVNTKETVKQDMVVTLYKNPEEWWKLDKEYYLRDLVGNDPDLVLPAIIDSGDDNLEDGKPIRFLVREFAQGQDLDQCIIGHDQPYGDIDWVTLNSELGATFGALHKHEVPFNGLIRSAEVGHLISSSWSVYVTHQLESEIDMIQSLQHNHTIGIIGTNQVQASTYALSKRLGTTIDSNSDHIPLVHGDARMGNVIGTRKDDKININTLVDFEWALGGDPDIDLAFLENWLYFTNYKEEFFSHSDAFVKGYSDKRKISNDYSEKRTTYHALRSMNFLRIMFRDFEAKSINASPVLVNYVLRHFQIIAGLSMGQSLADIGIPDLTRKNS
jgi:hypothetical protein